MRNILRSVGGSLLLAGSLFAMQQAAYADDYAPGSCARFDKLNTRGAIVSLNSSNCDSIAPHLFGLRDDLYKYGINLTITPSFTASYDMLGHDKGTQIYGGQKPQADVGGFPLTLTMDLGDNGILGDMGLPGNAQLTAKSNYSTSTYGSANSGSPHVFSFSELAIEQEFNDKQIQLIYGWTPQVYNFYGMILGGNSSSAALGPSSVIPFETGMSAAVPTPSFTMKTKDNDSGLYNTFSVTRSVHPDGQVTDAAKNTTGLNITEHGAKVMFMDEVGYEVAPINGQRSVWLRAGGSYNTSTYKAPWDTSVKQKYNYSAYAAATVQLTQPIGNAVGLYLDVKYDYAPPKVNLYSSDVQLTMYYVGCFGRPDMFSIGFTKNYLSKQGVRAFRNEMTSDVATGSTGLSISYAAHLANGVYIVPGVTYTRNPSIVPQRKNALVGQIGLNFVI